MFLKNDLKKSINLLLTEPEGSTGKYWPEGQYSPVWLELTTCRLVSSLLYGTQVVPVLNLPAFENNKYTALDHFHGIAKS